MGFDRCSDEADLVFISSDAQLLRTPLQVRPQVVRPAAWPA